MPIRSCIPLYLFSLVIDSLDIDYLVIDITILKINLFKYKVIFHHLSIMECREHGFIK